MKLRKLFSPKPKPKPKTHVDYERVFVGYEWTRAIVWTALPIRSGKPPSFVVEWCEL